MTLNQEIPKVIHYCWFGGNPLPPLAEKCIDSWKKFLPDYEIKRWDESNFDVNIIPYTQQAYEAKKYAFVSDYARFWILYKYGGLYFDTDVEVIKPLDDIIAAGPFMGCENPYEEGATPNELGVNPGLGLGVNPGFDLYKEILDKYKDLDFIDKNGNKIGGNVVTITTEILCKKGLLNTSKIQYIDGIYVYPQEYFCPIDYATGKLLVTNNTFSIHHYMGSWCGFREKLYQKVQKIIGRKATARISGICKTIRKIVK